MNTNFVRLIGYVGQDIKQSTSKAGSKRLAIRMATHYKILSSSDTVNYQTVWHDVVAWDQTADYAACNFVKGSKIMVEGVLIYRDYLDSQGHRRYVTEIKAQSLLNLDR